jgi:hypothetical protein
VGGRAVPRRARWWKPGTRRGERMGAKEEASVRLSSRPYPTEGFLILDV